MSKNLLKNGIGLAWLALIAHLSYHFMDFYRYSFQEWKDYIWFYGVFVAAMAGVWGYHRIKKTKTLTISLIRISVMGLIGVVAMALIWLPINDAYVYRGEGYIVQMNDGTMMEIGSQELTPDMYVFMDPGQVVVRASDFIGDFPEEVQAQFASIPWWEFTTNVAIWTLKMFVFFLFLAMLFYGVGALLLTLFWKEDEKDEPERWLIGIALGMIALMLLLFLLAAFGVFTPTVVKLVIAGIFIVTLPESWSFLKKAGTAKAEIKWENIGWNLFTAGVLLVVFALDILYVIRPQPMGWDETHAYINIPKLMADMGTLVPYELLSAMPGYLMLTSLGFSLFNSVQAALWINLFGALLALILLFFLLRKVISGQMALLLTTLFAALPMVAFQMSMDVKIDLPLLFFALSSVVIGARWWAMRSKKESTKWLILLGIFLGMTFAIKITSAILIFTAFAFLGYAIWGRAGFVFFTSLAIGMLGMLNRITFWESGVVEQKFVIAASLIIGICALFYLGLKKNISPKTLKPFGIVFAVMAIVLAPYLIYNAIDTQSLAVHDLINGRSEVPVIDLEELGVDTSLCGSSTDYNVDMVRYQGFEKGFSLLWSIPYASLGAYPQGDAHFKDVGFIFLGFLLLLALHWSSIENKKFPKNLILALGIFYGLLWMMTTNGVLWYGFPGFIAFFVLYGKLWEKHRWMIVIVLIYLVTALNARMWMQRQDPFPMFYAGGLINAEEYMHSLYRGEEIIETVLNNPEAMTKNVYSVGGYLRFYIDENHRRVFQEAAMDTFNCLYIERDPELTLQRLRDLNFGYVVYNHMVHDIVMERVTDQIRMFEQFAAENLPIVISNSDLSVFIIPEAESAPADPDPAEDEPSES